MPRSFDTWRALLRVATCGVKNVLCAHSRSLSRCGEQFVNFIVKCFIGYASPDFNDGVTSRIWRERELCSICGAFFFISFIFLKKFSSWLSGKLYAAGCQVKILKIEKNQLARVDVCSNKKKTPRTTTQSSDIDRREFYLIYSIFKLTPHSLCRHIQFFQKWLVHAHTHCNLRDSKEETRR